MNDSKVVSTNSDVILVRDLFKQYENDEVVTPVLHNLNFSVPKGQFLAIMGPSGSGKSTLMHILGFLDVATSGLYEFDGEDVTKFNDAQLASMRGEKIGFVFQAFNLLPKAKVLENVRLPLLYSYVPTSKRHVMA